MKRQLAALNPALTFGLALTACTFALFAIHAGLIDAFRGLRPCIAESLLNALTVALPYFFLPARWRTKVIWTVLALLTLIFEINILYYRSFGSIPGLSALKTDGIFSPMVLRSAADLFNPGEFMALAAPLILLIIARKWLKSGKNFSLRLRLTAVVCWLAAPPLLFVESTYWRQRWDNETGMTVSNQSFGYHLSQNLREMTCASPYKALTDFGLLPYLYRAVASAFPPKITLTDRQKSEITDFIRHRAESSAPIAANRGKNLILIIVESLNSTTLQTPATPFLNELIRRDGTFTALNLASQIGPGASSDGQFIYNTGLLPLADEPLVANYADCNYPSLAKSLPGYSSTEIIAEGAALWNHHQTTAAYGFDRLIANVAPDGLNQDATILDSAANRLNRLKQPFFAEITTISMHVPYSTPHTTLKISGSDGSRTANYLNATAHFDSELRRFFARLQECGLLENTVVAITGDHPAPQNSGLADSLLCQTVPLIIVNAGPTSKIDLQASQADVYPTLLDVMGAEHPYRGIGRSLLNGLPEPTPDNARRISELIIRSREGIAVLPEKE